MAHRVPDQRRVGPYGSLAVSSSMAVQVPTLPDNPVSRVAASAAALCRSTLSDSY